jgi:NAD-specific glutamate dehydrogenase
MKTFLIAICALVVGVAAGAFCMHVYDAKELFAESLAVIQETGKQDAVQVMVSVNLLELLEDGKMDTIRKFLVGRVASYYRTFHDFQPMSAETRKLMDQIRAASEKSPSLKEALNAPPK